MDKRRLNKLKPVRMPKDMYAAYLKDKGEVKHTYRFKQSVREVRVYEHYKYMAAEIEDEILKVAIWTRESVGAKQMEPDYTIFIDRVESEWLTKAYDGRWLTAAIFRLKMMDAPNEVFGTFRWASAKTEKTVSDYLCITDGPWAAVRRWQIRIKEELKKNAYKSELQQIDEFMESVPPAPKGFNNEWLIKTGYEHDHFLMFQPGQKTTKGRCTRCQREVELKIQPVHNMAVTCPKCHRGVTMKSWGKQKELIIRKNVGLLQKTKADEWCLSVDETALVYEREKGWRDPKIMIGKRYRFRLAHPFVISEEFDFWEYKNTGVYRWCHARYHGMGYSAWYATDNCKLYTGNLENILKDTELRYIPIKKLLAEKEEVYVAGVLRKLHFYSNDIEKMVKVGMTRLAWDVIQNNYSGPYIDHNQEKLKDILGLSKELTAQAVRLNAGKDELKVLRAAKNTGKVLTDEQVHDLTRMFYRSDQRSIEKMLNRGNIEKSIQYVKRVAEQLKCRDIFVISHDYEDFIEQLEQLNIEVSKGNRFPKDFDRVHRQLAEVLERQKEKRKQIEDLKTNRELQRRVKEIKEQYEAPSELFTIVWPQCREDFVKEGQRQHNCVANYFERMARGETVVFFLRRSEDIEKPFCTVEFREGQLIQCRSINNGAAPDEARKYMDAIRDNYMAMKEAV